MTERSCLSVILAAGEGTRMKSALPKVLHEVAGLPLIGHVAKMACALKDVDVAVVVGREAERVQAAILPIAPEARVFTQAERLGTAHAVLAARDSIAKDYDDVLILFGDTPLIEKQDLADLRAGLADGAAVVVMGFHTDDPTGYGRLIIKDGALIAIREEKDANAAERAVTFCNGGLMAISGRHALALLDSVDNANSRGEYYLTDIVEIAVAQGLDVRATEAPYESILGINTRLELAEAENVWQKRRRRELLLAGVTMIAPETVQLCHDTQIGADALIEPNVFFGPGVVVEAGARIRAFSYLDGAHVGPDTEIGPFARLRPGTQLHARAKVGNFCEVKNAVVEERAKVNHLTYIGDAHIGPGANIGAGTITCNYDGFSKHQTLVGAGAFVGSNSSLVAPLTIGAGAYVASGSVVTQDVPDDALAFGRARQETKQNLGRRLRERLGAKKSK